MSTKAVSKKLLKYGAQALLDMGCPARFGELRRQQRSVFTLGRKKWQLCYVILARDCLFVFDNKNANEAHIAIHFSSLECAKTNCQVDIDGEDVCFIVRFEEVDKNPLIFACDVEKTRLKWINSINEEIMKIKKFSADSGYVSGGSFLNENNYYEIVGSTVTTNAVCKNQTELDSDQQDSGFINIGIHSSIAREITPHTWLERVYDDGTSANTQTMQYLKLPVPESTSWPENSNALNNDGNSQNIYANTADNFATYSYECFQYEQTKHCTSPSTTAYWAARQTTMPKVAISPTKSRQKELQRTEMAAQSSSTEPVSVQQDSAYLLVGINYSSIEAKATHEPREWGLYENTAGNSHLRPQNLKLHPSVSREMSSDDSNCSEESPIYENNDFDKVFERDDYICEQRKIPKHLKTEPIGTFCVRPGDETKQEIVIKTEDGYSAFRIHEKNGRVYLFEGTDFPSLDKLLSFYSYTEIPSRRIKVTLKRGYNSNTP